MITWCISVASPSTTGCPSAPSSCKWIDAGNVALQRLHARTHGRHAQLLLGEIVHQHPAQVAIVVEGEWLQIGRLTPARMIEGAHDARRRDAGAIQQPPRLGIGLAQVYGACTAATRGFN